MTRRRQRLLPIHPWRGTATLVVDVAAFNLVFYFFVRSALFCSAGFGSGVAVAAWGAALVAVVAALGWLPVQGRRATPLGLAAMLAACFAFVGALAWLARIMPEGGRGLDFSFLVAESIKVPLWLGMLTRVSPVFTAVFALAVCGLMRWTAGGGNRWLLVAAAGGCCLAASLVFGQAFAGMIGRYQQFYWVAFAGPLLLVCVAAAVGWFRFAFRFTPLAFHVLLMGLNYVGALPVHSLADLAPGDDLAARAVQLIPGARLLYRPTVRERQTDFRFPRRLLRVGDELLLAAGPMGDARLFAFDRRSGERRRAVKYEGLIRDMQASSDGGAVWASDWDYSELTVLDPSTLATRCRLNLAASGLHSPWLIRSLRDRIYLTSQTNPLLAEFKLPPDANPCEATLARSIDFHRIGYLPFTDGVFGLDVDEARGTALVTAGMLERRYQLALVEVGLDDFAMRRELRMPCGVEIARVSDASRVLLPSYYLPAIFEVDVDRWELARTIRAAANVFGLAYDPARRLIYAASRAAGLLQVIDYATGKLVREDFVGNKPEPLLLDGDELYVASRWGVLAIDLSAYVGPPRR